MTNSVSWTPQVFEFPKESPREEILNGALEAVMKQRNNTYGPPTQDFEVTASVLNSLGFRRVNRDGSYGFITSFHIAELMIALKLARLAWSPGHKDNWLDIAGYSACGWECVKEEIDNQPSPALHS